MEHRLRLARHLGPPALVALGFAVLYAVPVELLGCWNRGLVALGLIGGSILGAFVAMGLGVRIRHAREESAVWFLTAAALLLPAIVVLSVELVLSR